MARRKNTRKDRKNRKNRKTMKGGSPPGGEPASNTAAAPMANAPVATPANQPTNSANSSNGTAPMTGGRRRKSHKMSSGAAKWRDHMMKVYREMKSRNPATKLGDAMRAAKKSYNA